jgi:hypothetical protein
VQTQDDTEAIEAGNKELRNAETNHMKFLAKEKKLASQVQKEAAKEQSMTMADGLIHKSNGKMVDP